MNKEQNVIKFYCLCNKLKNVIRTGWINWDIDRDRVESVAEHIYSTQMLAISMYSEYNYNLDIYKVIYMLAIHELEEIIIGDIPQMSQEHKNKQEKGHEAIKKILSCLLDKEKIEYLILEFDERKTKEAIFAYHCDKLECDLQAKLYEEEGCFKEEKLKKNKWYQLEIVQDLIKEGYNTFSKRWFHTDENKFIDDENFMKVFLYARDNKICLDKDE